MILVPRQSKKNNDCSPCVNEIARAFARDPEGFLSGEVDLNFDSLSLRFTQAATLLKWLHRDDCEDVQQSAIKQCICNSNELFFYCNLFCNSYEQNLILFA